MQTSTDLLSGAALALTLMWVKLDIGLLSALAVANGLASRICGGFVNLIGFSRILYIRSGLLPFRRPSAANMYFFKC
ncbi:hypothetical protein QBC32DRAFT_355855 [Pseudoneurospora amorphoporcata]|uniref:Uncharacterized protein n=1 Tax=Pseudoneurospora amorphoporcata TaxID=241081 RepID=A0AAN6SBF3_9PEZI|nr:hypothetical protein QBC32DRAFT_355855 [Pseudoneurospora amorphoporcata]